MSTSESLLRPAAPPRIAPRNDIEARLAALWAKVLAVPAIGVSDNFFASGGDSFQALRLAAEIESAFARTLPLGVIFSLPTIEQLAALLDHNRPASAGFSLVPLQTAGSGRPIFVVHWTLRELVRHLGAERPIYALSFGLAAQTAQQRPALPPRLEDLAAQYVGEMRLVQPHGPYALIGYSAGGVVAFEMAQQLLAAGETVGFLGLIDTIMPREYFDKTVSRHPLHRQVANLFRLPPREISYSLKRHYLRPLGRRLRSLVSPDAGNQADDQVFEDGSSLEFWTAYTPRQYPGKLTLFKASGLPSVRNRRVPPERAWQALSEGGVEIHEVPGRHFSVVAEPNVRVLAARLRACLDRGDA